MSAILSLRSVKKSYGNQTNPLEVLRGIDLEMEDGETAAIVGPSGSGKTTLLSLCAGLDLPSSGEITVVGTDISGLSEDGRAQLRVRNMGFIFQSFHLMPSLTALENVLLPMELKGIASKSKAEDLLDQVGLGDRLHHYPSQLSGGERQRVGVARAFANSPRILFADEPTGNLDRETSGKVADLIFNLNRELGTTLLLITHDLELARRAARQFDLVHGRLIEAEQGCPV